MQVDPQVFWLREEYGSRAFFPGPDDLEFEFSSEVGDSIIDLVVEGSNSSVGS